MLSSSVLDGNTTSRSHVFIFQCRDLIVEYPVEGLYLYVLKAMIGFDIVFATVCVVLNFLILKVMFQHQSLRTIPNCILMNLAFSDILTGLLSQPLKAVLTAFFLKRVQICPLYLTGLQLGYIFGMVSCLTLMLMAFERYLAIFRPFRYIKMTVDRRWLYSAIASIWIGSLSIALLSFFTPGMSLMRMMAIGIIILTISCSSLVYTRAIMVVKKINTRVSAIPDETTYGTDRRADKHATLAHTNRKLKATRMASLILAVMIACYLPSCVLTTLRNIAKTKSDVVNGLHDWGQSFVLLNSSLNPIIYCWNLSEMRKRIKSLIRCSER